ncbi:MAG: hypothetical protein DWQ05_16350 [Calditrichaeota bacterium]|nr:MAG: hypothetical protein DWQ05_16350 [Calditrichota bacterium]
MPENFLFYIVFLSQIILISFYYPRQILSRIAYVLRTFPASKYPKLYPKQVAFYEIGQSIYRVVNHLILALGFIVLIAIASWDSGSSGKVSEAIPVAYFFVQMIPLFIMEFSGFAYFKLMRKADMRTKRKADLLPRRLFDFISPLVFVAAVIMFLSCIGFFYSLHQFKIDWSNDTFTILLTQLATNLLFAGIIYWNLYGKKIDPYQDGNDRLKQVEVTIKSLFFMSIASSLFLMIFEAIDEFNLDYFEPALMSGYFQFILFIGLGSMLRNQRIEDMNFDVYKEDAATI